MKNNKLVALLIGAVLFLAGCTSLTNTTDIAVKIQNILTNALPPDFQGDVHFGPNNPYFDIAVDITGLHKTTDGKWAWDGLSYARHDAFHTSFVFTMTPKPHIIP